METQRHGEHRVKREEDFSVPSVPLCFKRKEATMNRRPTAQELDAAIRQNLEVLGYGE